MTANQLLARYFEWLSNHRKPQTIRIYRSALKAFGERFGDRQLDELKADDIENLLAELGRGKSNNTRRSQIVAFETLQSWAIKYAHLPARICPPIEKPRGKRRERFPSAEEIELIISNSPPDFSIAYRALAQSGARPSELAAATIGQYDKLLGTITLQHHKTERTGKARTIVVGKKLAALITESIGTRNEPHEPIFRRADGRGWTAPALGNQFRQARQKAGLPSDLVLYGTRHYFISEVCKRFPITVAAALAGHSSTSTTEVYTHTDHQHLRDVQDSI